MGFTTTAAEAGWIPDFLIRIGIRRMLGTRLQQLSEQEAADPDFQEHFLEELRSGPIALVPEIANEQHYEVEPAFFQTVLGPRLKYSGGSWPSEVEDLAASEEAMLALTCRHAQIRDGMRVLDLGCGWGSLSIWIAEQHPTCKVVAVSNSKPQAEFIRHRCQRHGIGNLEVVTADMNHFEADGRFDRVVSVEMFEHIRNHERLLERIERWLEPGGKLFVHIFSHARYAYPYETEGDGNWMGRHFFTGGIMPSEDLLLRYRSGLSLEERWRVGGEHYQKTSEAWLQNLDERREEALASLTVTYGKQDAMLWLRRWRIFFLACAELFGYRGGREWFVSHYRFAKP